MKQLTIMMIVPDMARADVMLMPERTYYRFATVSSTEDGNLPGLGDRHSLIANRLLEALKPLEDEEPLKSEEVKLTVFVDNVVHPTKDISEKSLRRMIDELTRIDDVFAFVQGFCTK